MGAGEIRYTSSQVLRAIHHDQLYLFLGAAFITVGMVSAASSLPGDTRAEWGFTGAGEAQAVRSVACILKNMLDFEISTNDLAAKLASGEPSNLVLLDVREPWECATAKIEGSVPIPMGEIPARLQELDPEDHIVTICHAGVRSMNVAVWLRNQGLENVQSLRGGIDAWSREIDPLVPRY